MKTQLPVLRSQVIPVIKHEPHSLKGGVIVRSVTGLQPRAYLSQGGSRVPRPMLADGHRTLTVGYLGKTCRGRDVDIGNNFGCCYMSLGSFFEKHFFPPTCCLHMEYFEEVLLHIDVFEFLQLSLGHTVPNIPHASQVSSQVK